MWNGLTKRKDSAAIFFLSSLISVLLYLREALLVNVRNYPFDDGLFVGRAESLIGDTEKTLGSTRGFNPLVKGQIYPFVLEVSNFLKLNPLVLVYILFLFSVMMISIFLYQKNKNLVLILSITLFVLLDPSPFSAQASRIAREFTYEILVFISFALLIKTKFLLKEQSFRLRSTSIILLGTLAGLLMFLANNTREERAWIFLIWTTGFIWVVGKNKRTIFPIILISVTTIIAYNIFNSYLRNYNQNVFGVKLTSTTIEGQFPQLMSNLSSIAVSETYSPYVSISESKRQIAYENSPSFSLLKNYLEGDGRAWIQFGCQNSQTCDDYANGWFHVALRVAIDEKGFWITQKRAQDFMFKVNNELELACVSGKMMCNRTLPMAKALGVTQVTIDQLVVSANYLKLYVLRSVLGWNTGQPEHSAYEVMEQNQWKRWSYVIETLPDNQAQYQNKYNNRISIFNPIYQKWVSSYFFVSLLGILAFLFTVFRLIFYRKKFKKIELIFISIAFYSLFIWFSRGALLAINSATNFVSISENYALPGRVFLTLAYSIFLYLGVKTILRNKYDA
jgi:hypothetical protein